MKCELLNKKFGRLTVVGEAGLDKNRSMVWDCVCECGNTKQVISAALNGGRVRSCGCLRRKPNIKNRKHQLENMKFGRLTVLKEYGRSKDRKHILWLCECICGNKSVVNTSNLVSGHTRSCGCLQRELALKCNKLYLSGKKFGRLLVVKEAKRIKNSAIKWECVCDCGNATIVAGGNLVNGHTQSCGCLAAERTSKRLKKELNGERFGRLLVIREVEKSTYGVIRWLCKCDCGKEITTTSVRLLNGQTKSCGCLHREAVSKENSRWWIKDRSKLVGPLKCQISGTFEYNKWRKKVFNRDAFVCQKCGDGSGGNLNAHHIISFQSIIHTYSITTMEKALYCKLLFDEDNGITLCESCHRWVHSNANINNEFMELKEEEN